MNYLNRKEPWINFKMLLNNEIYVDKSKMIAVLNEKIATNHRYVCITRPRRFEKTANVSMLGAYYTKGYDSHEVFDQLHISDRKS